MKKKNILALILVFVLLLSAGCAAKSEAMSNTSSSRPSTGGFNSGYDSKLDYEDSADIEMDASADYAPEEPKADGGMVESSTVNYAEKIIYTAHAEVQTLKFDEAVEQVAQLVERLGGFVQSSSVTARTMSEWIW